MTSDTAARRDGRRSGVMRPWSPRARRSTRLRPLLLACAAAAVVVACGPTAQASWTYDPSLGLGSPGAPVAASPGGSPVASPALSPSVPPLAGSASPGASETGGGPSLIAKGVAFDTSRLTAPANQPFTLSFDNQDAGIQHNVAIYSDKSGASNLFRGAIITGPLATTYQVPALPAGTYYFQCDVHPAQMNGTIVVK